LLTLPKNVDEKILATFPKNVRWKNIANNSKKLLTKNNKKSQSVWYLVDLNLLSGLIRALIGFYSSHACGSYIGAPVCWFIIN
jgi:hypothetical protein